MQFVLSTFKIKIMSKLFSIKKSVPVNHVFPVSIPLLVLFRFPEIAFTVFLIPSKQAALIQKLHLPPIINLTNLLFSFILAIIITIALKRQKVPTIPKRLILPYTGLVFLMLISLSYTSNLNYGMTKTIEFITLTTLACFAPFFLFRSAITFERFLKTFIVLGVLLSIIVLATSPYSFKYYYTEISYAKFETFVGSNYLAIQYILGIASLSILYYFLLKNVSKKQTICLILLLIFFCISFLYSPGKGPIVSFFFTIILMTISSLRFKNKKILINMKIVNYAFLIMAIGGLLMFSIGWVFILRTKALFIPEYYGRVERLENAKIAFELFYNHPLSGIGIGGFGVFSAEIEGIKEKFIYPHNILLEIISELGLFGLIFFIILIGFAFKQLFYLKNKYRCSNLFPLTNVVISLLIFSFLTSLFSGNINNQLLFAWIGTVYTLEQMVKYEENKCKIQNQ